MVGGGAISGGFGASISGGDFWHGFGAAATTGLMNHVLHNRGGTDPWEVIRSETHELGGRTDYFEDGSSAFYSSGGAVQFYNADGSLGPFYMAGGQLSSTMAPHEYLMGGAVMRIPIRASVKLAMNYRWFRKNIYNEFPSEQGRGYSVFNVVRFHTHHTKYHGPHRQIDFNWFGNWHSIRLPR